MKISPAQFLDEAMTDLVNMLMLVCASLGSMAFGILAAYGLLRTAFAVMARRPRTATIKVAARMARVS
jgi:hypothetical protein